jgi:hypothetical protein
LVYIPHLPLPDKLIMPGLTAAMITVVLALFQTFLAWKNKIPSQHKGIWLAYLAFMPPLFLWLVSQIVPIFIERAFLPSHAIFCIWVAWAFTQTKLPKLVQALGFGLIAISAIMGIFQHVSYRGFPYGPFSTLDKRILGEYQQGDIVIHSNKLSYLPAYYFDPEMPQGYIADPMGSHTDTLAPATQEVLHIQDYDNLQTAIRGKNRIWFIIYQKAIDEYVSQGFQTHPDLEYLDTNYSLRSTEIFDDLRLYLYTRREP